MIFLATWPFLKRIIVGIERTSNFAAVCWFSSTLSLTILRSSRSAAISSSTGATTRHGPHQGAQKSTSTGCSDSMTSAWKLVSVTSVSACHVGLLGRCRSTCHYTKCSDRSRRAVASAYMTARGEAQQVRRDVDLDERARRTSTGTAIAVVTSVAASSSSQALAAAGDASTPPAAGTARSARAARGAAASSSSRRGAIPSCCGQRGGARRRGRRPGCTSENIVARDDEGDRQRARPCSWTRAPPAAVALGLQRAASCRR